MNRLKNLSWNIFLLALIISPLFFFTDVTRNPYLVQERIFQVLIVAALFMLLFSQYSSKEVVLPRTFLDLPLWSFVAVCMFSIIMSLIFFSEYRDSLMAFSVRRMLMFMFSGIICFYFAAASGEKYFIKIQNTVIAAGSLASLYAIMQLAGADFIWSRTVQPYGQRSISTFGNPTFLSSFLLVVNFWIFGRLLAKKYAGVWFLLLLINLTGLAITMTRSTFIGIFAGFVLLVYLLAKSPMTVFRKIKGSIYLFFLSMIFIAAVFAVSSPQFVKRVKGIVNVENMGSALTQRLLIWESSLNMFMDTPVIGRGWGNFEVFYPFYQGEMVKKERYRRLRTHANNSHNFLFELLTQVGIVGTGVYLWLIAVYIYSSRRIYSLAADKDRIPVLIFTVTGLAFWIDNILNVSLFFPMPAMAFWLNAGLLAAIGRRYSGFPVFSLKIRKSYPVLMISLLIFGIAVIYFNYVYFFSSVNFFRGFKYSKQTALGKAEKYLMKCYELYPYNVDNNYELGNIYARMSRKNSKMVTKAIWAYAEAIKANPGYDEIYFNLGVMHMNNGNIIEGEKYLKKALAINPVSADTYKSLGDLRGRQKKYDEAIYYYEEAIKNGSDNETTYNNFGFCNEMTGNDQVAMESYFKALTINPEFKNARNNFIRLSAKNRKKGSGQETIALFHKTDMFIKEKDWPAALELIRQIRKISPWDLRALLYEGNLYFKNQEPVKAIGVYRVILAIDPSNITAKSNLDIVVKAAGK
ncbi:MAG: O-antigen ligase family protein [Elusimicrobiota bacterium]